MYDDADCVPLQTMPTSHSNARCASSHSREGEHPSLSMNSTLTQPPCSAMYCSDTKDAVIPRNTPQEKAQTMPPWIQMQVLLPRAVESLQAQNEASSGRRQDPHRPTLEMRNDCDKMAHHLENIIRMRNHRDCLMECHLTDLVDQWTRGRSISLMGCLVS